MSRFSKEIEDIDSVCALSDDESTPFRRGIDRRKNMSLRLVVTFFVVAYVILGVIYVELRFRYARLEAGTRSSRLELFPGILPSIHSRIRY
jgi:hypothetical protein